MIPFKVPPVIKQFFAIVSCNLLTLSSGIVYGWATINYNDLQNENSTFSTGPLTSDQLSLVVAIVSVGGLTGNYATLPVIHIFGVKRMIHSLGLILLISSLLVIWAYNVYYLYVSRFMSGLAMGALVVGIPTLVNDISFDRVRGALNALYDPSFNTGVMISYFMGNYLSCLDQAKAQLVVPVLFMIIMFFLPDSPEFWANKDEDKAIKSRKFYKGSIAGIESDQSKEEESKSATDESESDKKVTFSDFCTPHAKRAFAISFISLILCFLSGTLTILAYVTDIFSRTGSSLSEKNSSVLISIIQIIANLVLLNIIERFNRRTLYIASSFVTAGSYFLFGVYCLWWYDDSEFQWMPLFCFACIVFFSCLGLLPIPFTISMEIFPKKIRPICMALAISFMWIILFILGLIFSMFLEMFGLFKCMITLGVASLLNALFGIFFVPETRGKSFDEIAKMLS